MTKPLRLIFAYCLFLHFCTVTAQWDMVKFQSTELRDYISHASLSFDGKKFWAASASSCDTFVYLSEDGGYTYKKLNFKDTGACRNIGVIMPLSDTVVYLTTGGMELYHTTDGGKTWPKKIICNNGDTAFRNAGIQGIFFYDSLHGSAVGNTDTNQNCKEIWNTADGGFNWHRLSCDSIKIPYNETIGFTCGIFGSTAYFENTSWNGQHILVSHHYGHYWERRYSSTLSSQTGRVTGITFRDSFTGIGVFDAKDPKNDYLYYGITHDGGRTWDTTLQPEYAYRPKYIPAGGPNDSGFWFINGLAAGSFLSYDDFKTTQKFSYFNHLYFFYRDTKHFITSIVPYEDGYDLLIFKYFGYTALPQAPNKVKEVKTFPNPFRNELMIESAINGSIKLLDAKGYKLKEKKITKGVTNINTSELPAGFYVLVWETADRTESIKLIKTD